MNYKIKNSIKYLLKIFLCLFILINIAAIFYAYKFTHYSNPTETNIKKQDNKTTWDKIKDALLCKNAVKLKILLPQAKIFKLFI